MVAIAKLKREMCEKNTFHEISNVPLPRAVFITPRCFRVLKQGKDNKTPPAKHRDIFRLKCNASARVRTYNLVSARLLAMVTINCAMVTRIDRIE